MNIGTNRLMQSCLFLFIAVPLFAQTAYVRTTIKSGTSAPYCIPWVDSGAKAGTAWATTNGYIEILPNTQYQTIQGFGGCFQEKMWDALSHCSAAGRDSVIRAVFDTSGCDFTVMRMPIGANDFSDGYYSLDDVAGDNSMTSFSLHRDSTKLIPLIKWAQAVKPDLRFWASPWTPPSWMKQNNNYYTNTTAAQNHIKTDATTMTAYALYLSKAVQEFKKAGITIEYITCQNEPDQDNHNYPTCGWTFAEEMTFYKTYMFPRFTQDNLTTKLILGVYCCTNFNDGIAYFMNDATVAAHVGVTSHSFEDNSVGPQAYAAYPSIPFWETESNYGVLSATTQVQDWAAGVAIFNTEAAFMATGRTSVYTQWNIVNNQKSQSGWGWAQYVMVTVDTTNGRVTYNPHFWAQKHFSYYVKVGAKAVNFTTNGLSNLTSAAFKNPNGDIILVTGNANSSATPITVKVGTEMYKATLPANSFTTLQIVTTPTVVQKEKDFKKGIMSALNNARISNSVLSFSLPAQMGAQEMNITLTDLQGRSVWTGFRGSAAMQGGQQVFAIKSAQGVLRSGNYFLTVKVKDAAGVVTTVEKIVVTVN